jgi:hypothetical protein
MGDELSELINIKSSTLGSSKLLDCPADELSSLIWIKIVNFILIFPVPSLFLEKWIVNEFIVQEFIENIELFH